MSYQQIQIYFFLGLLVGITTLTIFVFLPYAGPLLVGATFAIIFYPLHQKILYAVSHKESLAALLTTAIILIVILAPLIYFGVEVFQQARDLYRTVTASNNQSALLNTINTFIGTYVKPFFPQVQSSVQELFLNFSQYIRQFLSWVLQNFGSFFSSIARIMFSLILSLFALYYLLKDGKKFTQALIAISPLADQYDKEILAKLRSVINSVIKGTLVVAVIQGILAGLGFFTFGVPNAAIWGAVTIVTALLPAIGTALITIPAIIYLFVVGNTVGGIGLLIWSIVIVAGIDNFLRPKLIERDIRIHPFLILLSVLGGIRMFGPIGFLIGPLILSLLFALFDIYKREFQEYISHAS